MPLAWFQTLEQALDAFDDAAFTDQVQAGEAERAAILERFSLQDWADMGVEDYALGTGRDAFSSYLEHKSPNLGGMPAHHAGIHLIYKEGGERWRFPSGYESVHDAWKAVRAGFVRAFELAARRDYGAIDALEVFRPGRLTLTKALHVYFPDRFLPISARSHLDLFARRVLRARWRVDHGKLGPAGLNAALLDALRERPGLEHASTVALMHALYAWTDPSSLPPGLPNRGAPVILKVAPGEDGHLWSACLTGGYVCVGYDDLGDLRAYERESDLRAAFGERFGEHHKHHKPTITRKSRELWHLRKAPPGAVVLANKGMSHVLAVGQVVAPGYRWMEDRDGYKHTLGVKWDTQLSGPVPKQGFWGFATVHAIEPQDWDGLLGPLVAAPPILAPNAEPDAPRPPRTWLFQSNPRIYDLAGSLRNQEGTSWRVNRYAEKMRPGDHVFMWESGPNARLRGIATMVSAPRPRQRERADPYLLNADRLGSSDQEVELRWERYLPHGPTRDQIRAVPGLAELEVLRMPQGTNFRVRDHEAEALRQLIESEDAGAVEDEGVSFASLLGDLTADGHHFPPELVANLILALQTKRLAILTGISGTGKTHIALSLAKQYPLVRMREVVAEPLSEDAISLTMQPYMHAYKRITLPAAITAQLPTLRDVRGPARLTVAWPGGQLDASVYAMNSIVLLWKGPLREWFESHAPLGATLILEVDETTPDHPILRLRLPRQVQRAPDPLPNHAVIAVRPDWTDNRGLLGYFNPLTDNYVTTPFLRLLLAAREEADAAAREERHPHPFFVILDEMNLARVEHYFSDFLSALESGEPLHLHHDSAVEGGERGDSVAVPCELRVPGNVFFIGTVNVDETTYMFSPKVLDRAFTLEFNDVALDTVDGDPVASPLELDQWNGRLLFQGKPDPKDWQDMSSDPDLLPLRDALVDLHRRLAVDNRHFGYRVANEIARFVLLARRQASHPSAAAVAMDLAMLEKVLPKLHGTQHELAGLLDELLCFALDCEPDKLADWKWRPAGGWRAGDAPETPRFPRTATKLWRMRRRLQHQGFTSFVE